MVPENNIYFVTKLVTIITKYLNRLTEHIKINCPVNNHLIQTYKMYKLMIAGDQLL